MRSQREAHWGRILEQHTITIKITITTTIIIDTAGSGST
jgi:hypothetical protein